MEFRLVQEEEIDKAYSIIEDRYQFLKQKGIDQYPCPYPLKDTFSSNVCNGKVYAIIDLNYILSIVTLQKMNSQSDWNYSSNQPFYWITAFFTNISFKGRDLGALTLNEVCSLAQKMEIPNLLLDCYKDGNFLEDYYLKYGFRKIDEKLFKYPGRQFWACLMKL